MMLHLLLIVKSELHFRCAVLQLLAHSHALNRQNKMPRISTVEVLQVKTKRTVDPVTGEILEVNIATEQGSGFFVDVVDVIARNQPHVGQMHLPSVGRHVLAKMLQQKFGLHCFSGDRVPALVTNAHVLNPQRALAIRLPWQTSAVLAKVIGYSRHCDLALLAPVLSDDKAYCYYAQNQIEMLPVNSQPTLTAENPVRVEGFPGRYAHLRTTQGILQQLEATEYAASRRSLPAYPISKEAEIGPGSSGGPVTQIETGQVIGIVHQANLRSSSFPGQAIPASLLVAMLRTMLGLNDHLVPCHPELSSGPHPLTHTRQPQPLTPLLDLQRKQAELEKSLDSMLMDATAMKIKMAARAAAAVTAAETKASIGKP